MVSKQPNLLPIFEWMHGRGSDGFCRETIYNTSKLRVNWDGLKTEEKGRGARVDTLLLALTKNDYLILNSSGVNAIYTWNTQRRLNVGNGKVGPTKSK